MDVSTPSCHYKPLFGAGDSEASAPNGIARFGEMTVDPGGASQSVTYPREEQVYFIEEGAGELQCAGGKYPVRRNDFMFLAAGAGHGLTSSGSAPLRAIVKGFKLPAGVKPAGIKMNRRRSRRSVVTVGLRMRSPDAAASRADGSVIF
jgi:quercetin dioxygenase-like cupin family protein